VQLTDSVECGWQLTERARWNGTDGC